MKGSLKPGLILVIISGLFIAPALGQYLYLLQNDCSSDKWIDSYPGSVYNSTLSGWTLTGSAPPEYENFTTYTELVGGALTETATRATFTDWSIEEEGALYTSKTPNSTFTAYWVFEITELQSSNPGTPAAQRLVSWSDGTQPDYYALRSGNYECFGVALQATVSQSDEYMFRLWETENGNAWISDLTTVLDVGTEYYLKFEKDSDYLNLTVYSDSNYSTYVDHTDHTMQSSNNNLPYFYALLGLDYSGTVRDLSGYVEYLTFEEPGGYNTEGWLYSEDLLGNTTMGPAYVYASQQTIPAGSEVYVSFSSDNSTWVRETELDSVTGDLHNSVYLDDLNYTSLYVRYNLTSSGLTTPLITSMDISYQIEDPGEGANGWIYALAAPITLLLGYAARHKPI